MKWFLLLMALGLAAQNPDKSVSRLTLAEAIDLGLHPGNRADLSLAGEATARAASNLQKERIALRPLLEARVTGGERTTNLAGQGIGSGQNAQVPFSLNPAFTTFDARPSLTMTLLNISQLKAVRTARGEVLRTNLERDWTAANAAYGISLQYVLCLEADAEVDASQRELQLSEELLAAAQQRLRAGTVTAVDVTRARSQVANDRHALLAHQQKASEAKLNLLRSIGLSYESDPRLEPTRNLMADGVGISAAEALAAANLHRLDLQMREQALKVSMAQLASVKAERYPTITGSFDVGRNGLTPADTRWTRTSQLNLNYTVFDAGRLREKATKAAITIREEKIRLDDLKREIGRQVQVALGKVSSAQAQMAAAKAESELAEAQLSQMKERSAVGLSTGLDISDAQARLSRSRRSTLKAEYAMQTASIELLHATGLLQERILKP